MALSSRQQNILRAIRDSMESVGYPPTVREICTATGTTSTSVVNYNLKRLEEKGYLLRDPETSRGIRLTEDNPPPDRLLLTIPLLGRIAAGAPLPIPDTDLALFAEESVSLTRDLLPDERDIFALEVRGTSMIDALINDGDIVIMRHQTVAENGDLVAVWLREERETTLKRFFHEGERIRLQPANPLMQPIYVDPDNAEVQGKVVLVIRQAEKSHRRVMDRERSGSPAPGR